MVNKSSDLKGLIYITEPTKVNTEFSNELKTTRELFAKITRQHNKAIRELVDIQRAANVNI